MINYSVVIPGTWRGEPVLELVQAPGRAGEPRLQPTDDSVPELLSLHAHTGSSSPFAAT